MGFVEDHPRPVDRMKLFCLALEQIIVDDDPASRVGRGLVVTDDLDARSKAPSTETLEDVRL